MELNVFMVKRSFAVTFEVTSGNVTFDLITRQRFRDWVYIVIVIVIAFVQY